MAFFFRKLPRNRNYVALLRAAADPRARARPCASTTASWRRCSPIRCSARRCAQRPALVARAARARRLRRRDRRAARGHAGVRRAGAAHRRAPVHRRRDAHRHLHAAHAGADRHAARQADRDAVARPHQPHEHGRVEGGARRRGGARQAGARVRRAAHASGGGASTPATPRGSPAARATSNLAALRALGRARSPGTMDHFFVQATEQVGEKWPDSEREAFAQFYARVPGTTRSCSSTPTTPSDGIRHAVDATGGKLTGVGIDSNVTPETVARARAAPRRARRAARARSSSVDGLDELRVAQLAGADGYGVGENITCSPDAAVGIGAVAKLTVNGYGKLTMKLARGTGKATLPGRAAGASLRRPRSGRARRRGGCRRTDANCCSRCGAGASAGGAADGGRDARLRAARRSRRCRRRCARWRRRRRRGRWSPPTGWCAQGRSSSMKESFA